MKDIKELKDKYKGKRCFIIGHGPSLSAQDLTPLKDELTIGCNEIIRKNFHPTYLCISGYGTRYLPNKKEIDNTQSEFVFLRLIPKWHTPEFESSIREDSYVVQQKEEYFHQSKLWDIDNLSYSGIGYSSIIELCLPLAYHLGAGPIYMLGLDNTRLCHFYETEYPYKKTYEKQQRWREFEAGYKFIREVFEKDGRNVYNASEYTTISEESLPRVKYEDIL